MARLEAAARRGAEIVVIDPRRTDTVARTGAQWIPIRPGTDGALALSMLEVMIDEELYDAEFCAQHTDGLDQLRAAVEPFTLDYVASRTHLSAEDIAAAARLFAAGPRGVAITGTGPEMSENPNLTQHLVASLNSLCGRYYREGETLPNPGVLAPPAPRRAQALNVPLAWSDSDRARSRIDENLGELTTLGMMGPVREMPCNLLSDEIHKVTGLYLVSTVLGNAGH